MKVLGPIQPSGEQLTVINDHKPGTTLIKGAAGSGKTTTALLRLKQANRFWQRRKRDGYVDGDVRILVLTYNRTLRGYIDALVRDQVAGAARIEVATFGKWSWEALGRPDVLKTATQKQVLLNFALPLGLPTKFLLDEVDYVTGRFLPKDLDVYVDPSTRRAGRGAAPRMESAMKKRLVDEVLKPYMRWKTASSVVDWNDLAVQLSQKQVVQPYHVVIVDEAQDFSANQVRAIQKHLAPQFSQTFVLDAAQRIYPRHFTWKEAGVDIAVSHKLASNYRNTAAIAALAAPLIEGLDHGDDGTIPDFSKCTRPGDTPVVVAGKFSFQMDHLISQVAPIVAAGDDTVAILHAAGGGWFDEVKRRLGVAGLPFVEISGESEWPTGSESIALSTMHSAKGLEFDHVCIVGLNSAVTPHGADPGDSLLETYQRLLAMAIGRARKTVSIAYKPAEASSLIGLLDASTYDLVSE